MVDVDTTGGRWAAGFDAMVKEINGLCADYGAEVEQAVRLAVNEPLDPLAAQRLFTEILVVLRTGGRAPDEATRRRVLAEIRQTVDQLVMARPGAKAFVPRGLDLVARNGLEPRLVVPTPVFNGYPIPMEEGYVDVETLTLWKGNHRVELQVEEFANRNQRDPDDEEMLALVQGGLDLPSLHKVDPFQIEPLAMSIARKGVERPPIVSWDGEPKDGNRRIAAARYVLANRNFTYDEKERARWIRVWRAPRGTTEDQFEAIVVALNFEPEHKQPWEEYVKGRRVVDAYRLMRREHVGRFTTAADKAIKKEVASRFAIKPAEVTRYLDMMQWSEDFQAYHEEAGRDQAAIKYRANDIFQYFYEIQAGRRGQKLTERLDQDDKLKSVVYDLMFDVLDSGAQVRKLHQVVADESALQLLLRAHELSATDTNQALTMVHEAIEQAARNSPTKKLGFEQWLVAAVERLGHAAPDDWAQLDVPLLADLHRVLTGALGAVQGALDSRGLQVPTTKP